MADRLTVAELEKMNKSVSDTTDLSRNLRVEFNKIKNTTDLLSDNFKKIVSDAGKNKNIAEKYLISQRAQVALSEKINELKSKSSYLDKVALDFKKSEALLQNQIARQNIKLIEEQINKNKIDAGEGLKRIESLKMQRIERAGELMVLDKLNGKQNKSIEGLIEQRNKTQDILDNIEIINDGESLRNKLLGFGKKVLGDMGPLGSAITESFNVTKMNRWVLATKIGMAILEKGYENFKSFDKASVDVRKNIGALPGQTNVLENRLKTVTIDMMHLGVTFDDVAKSINEIANVFTGLVAQDRDLLRTTTALSKQFGIAEGTSVKFLKALGGISGNSASSQKSMIGFAQKMAQASGVPLGKIMEDVATASDDVRVYVGSSAVSMIKAATAARMMGIDLNKAATSAEKLLQFESSINAELKASAILGQNINFNYARQLSFNKNIIGANQEILRIAKQVNFNQLNPIQQKAFADAAGKSVGELQDMLTQEKNIQLVRNGTNEKAKKALADYERMMQLKDEEAKNEGKVAEQQILQRANQEKLAQIQNKFNQLMSELAEPVMEVLDGFLTIATYALPFITSSLIPILGFIKPISTYIVKIGTKLLTWGRAMSIFGSKFLAIGKIIGTVAKFAGSFMKIFGTKIPVIGQIISALLFIRNYIRDVKRMFEEGGTWGEMIVKGLLLIPKAIIEAFLPFDSIKKKLDEWFFGKSPSKAGKLISKGFTSIGPELQDSLTAPINSAYKNIENMTPPEVSVETKGTVGLKSNVDNTLVNTIQSGNQQLIAKMDQLINMMANGGIAVNLDGQRVQSALSTTSYRFGGFGQSTT